MRNRFLFILQMGLMVFGCSVERSTSTPPDTLVAKFQALYPDAKAVTWEMEDYLYEASFKEGTEEKSVTLNPDGTVQVMETEIPPDNLPQAAKEYLAQQRGGKKISGAAMMTYADGHVGYEAEVGKQDYLFDGTGKYLSIESEDGEEEDEK